MKTILLSMIFISLVGLCGCEKQKDNPEVEKYIDQLMSGQYESPELPAFSPSDIPALLNFRNDNTIISNFPHNGLSSYWGPECELGMYVLWTIESIRAVEIKSDRLIGRFPSLNPILAFRDATELQIVRTDESHNEAAKAYYNWWHSVHIFRDKMKIDPLKETEYRWH
jgi:hypothetical protein